MKPWVNPPFRDSLGATRGTLMRVLAIDVAVVLLAIVALVLVSAEVLPRSVGYVALAVGIFGGAVAIVLGVFKARAESGGRGD